MERRNPAVLSLLISPPGVSDMTRLLSIVLALLSVALVSPSASAQTPKPGGGQVSFIQDVAPIFKENCFGCHGSKNPKGKLDMTKLETLRKGGTKDDPVVPGKPDESHLVDVLKATDASRMPPKETGNALAADKIAIIEKWISQGAKIDAGLTPSTDLVKELRRRWAPPAPLTKYAFPVQITALAFSPDGKSLVASGHHELTVWDIETGKLSARLKTRARRAMAMLFLPDGNLVAGGGRPGEEGDVTVYNLKAAPAKTEDGVAWLDGVGDPKVLVKRLLETDDEVQCLALSSDGKKLAAGGCDRMIHLWDLAPGIPNAKLEQSIENHADWVFGVVFSADGKRLASASRDKTAKLWDIAAKESLLTFPDHQNPVFGVTLKADGKLGFSAGEDRQIRSWTITADQGAKQAKAMPGHAGPILKLVQHPKNPWLITGSADNTVRLWNADTAAAMKTLSGHTDHVLSVAIHPDGATLASGSYNGEIRLWKIPDGTSIRDFSGSPGQQLASTNPANKK